MNASSPGTPGFSSGISSRNYLAFPCNNSIFYTKANSEYFGYSCAVKKLESKFSNFNEGECMQFERVITKEKNAKISIQVTVDKSSVQDTRESVIKDYEKNAKLPGFRKGKVPRHLILQRFAQNIKNETVNEMLSKSLSQILKESDYRPITDPTITQMGELAVEDNFTFSAECDIMPGITLSEYKEISSEKYIYDVTDKAVTDELEALRERFATLMSIDEKSKEGDYVVIDYEELSDENGERKKNQTILLDKKDDQLAKQLIGMAGGDEKDIELVHEYEDKDGKKEKRNVKLHVRMNEVKQKQLPELDDNFAQDISDAKTLKELKEKIRADIDENAKRLSEQKTKDELLKKIIEKTEFDIPKTMIDNEIDHILGDIAYSYRIDIEKLKQDDKKYREYRKNLAPRAVDNIKQDLVLNEISKKENITVTDREVDDEIRKYAESQKKEFESMKKQLADSRSTDSLRFRLQIGRALDFIYNNARLEKEKHITYQEEKN